MIACCVVEYQDAIREYQATQQAIKQSYSLADSSQAELRQACWLSAEAIDLALVDPEASRARLAEAEALADQAAERNNGEPYLTLDELRAQFFQTLIPSEAERTEPLDSEQFERDCEASERILRFARQLGSGQRDFTRPPTAAERRGFDRPGFWIASMAVAILPDPAGTGETLWLRRPRYQRQYGTPTPPIHVTRR